MLCVSQWTIWSKSSKTLLEKWTWKDYGKLMINNISFWICIYTSWDLCFLLSFFSFSIQNIWKSFRRAFFSTNASAWLHCVIKYHVLLYTGKISPPFYFRPFRPLVWGRIQNRANWILHKGLYNKIGERANSRLGESVLDICRAKIRLGEFKAVYSICMWSVYTRYLLTVDRRLRIEVRT